MGEIWIYKLGHGETELEMPVAAKILCAKTQRNEPHIWALVNPGDISETRTFAIYLTGQPADFTAKEYIDTIFIDDGVYVVHIFEVL